jgi:PAS domain S-box-containing protein
MLTARWFSSFALRTALVLMFLWVLADTRRAGADDATVRIGVLVRSGTEQCLQIWSPTAEYLKARIPRHVFQIVPLGYKEIAAAVEGQAIDFLIANSSVYVEMEVKYQIVRLATLKSRHMNRVSKVFGGVLFCQANRNDLQEIGDLRHKSLGAVDETSLGGWRAAWREIKEKGLNPRRDFKQLRFLGSHYAVVHAVQGGHVDAGVVGTAILEQMAAEGRIDLDDFRVINSQPHGDFPFLVSTRLYPEWPIARLKHVHDELAEKVSIALLAMLADSPAAQAASSAGWTVPLNYQPVDECLRELRVGPYERLGRMSFAAVIELYRPWIYAGLGGMMLLMGTLFTILVLNRNLRWSRTAMRQEISDRKLAETNLLRERKRAQTYLEVVRVILVALNERGEVTLINPMGCEVLGYAEGEILGRDWFDLCLPQDLKEQAKGVFRQLWVEGGIELFENTELPVITKTGRERLISWHHTRLPDETGHIIGILSSGTDITERKQAELQLENVNHRNELILGSTGEGIFGLDLKGRVTFINPAASRMIGWRAEELLGRNHHALVHHLKADGSPNPEGDCPVLATLRDGNSRHVTGEVYWKKDGSSFSVEYLTNPIHEKGQLAGAVITFRDITERLLAEEERERVQEQLRQVHRTQAIGTLAGGIAHDFNNILSAIIGYTEMALFRMPKHGPSREHLKQVLAAGQRAKELVKQIITFCRGTDQQLAATDMGSVIKEGLKLLRAALPTTIEIRKTIPSTLDPVLADPTQIHQILMNLCMNSAHAMGDKGGVLEVTLSVVQLYSGSGKQYAGLKPGDYLKFTVTDSGHGMSPEVMERIFDPFYTTKGPGSGYGMGLPVVQGIVQSHQGAISVDSKPGQGTTVNVLIPRVPVKEGPPLESTTSVPRGEERILFVDDEQTLVAIGQEMLASLGYQVVSETCPIAALKRFRDQPHQFDLIITDQTMPRMTGIEFASQVLTHRSDIPIVLSSGFGDETTLESAKAVGIREFIAKPVARRELAETIRSALDEDSRSREAQQERPACAGIRPDC